MQHYTFDIEGTFNVRCSTLYLSVGMTYCYDRDGDLVLDVDTVEAESERREKKMVKVSNRLKNFIEDDTKIREFLKEQAMENYLDRTAQYRELRRYNSQLRADIIRGCRASL